jgi:fructuronate reductase
LKLSRAALAGLPAGVARPGHGAIATGIVHFGPGAFHRAHQADFIDRLLDHDPRWGIAEVSLRSGAVTNELAAQDGLYTLELRDAAPDMRVIGAVSAVIGPGEGARLLAQLADPAVRLVTATVTEKGYCLSGDATLDFDHPDIVHDRAHPDAPRSVVGWLVAGLAARRAAGVAPFGVAPCDNLPDNGGRVAAAVVALARCRDAGLADWIAGECRFAATMVDAITPAADASLLARVAVATGCIDRAAVQRERFAQWVMADVLSPGGPDLAGVGVVMTDDVAGFERAKLRILNGAHSSLAYLGLLRGADSVAAAMADARLAAFVERMVIDDVLPGVAPVPGLDRLAYVGDVMQRFRNPAIHHRLAQIAIDGSQKLPYRLLDSVRAARTDGRPLARLLLPVAAWMRGIAQAPGPGAIDDPLAETLWRAAHDPRDPVARFLDLSAVFPAELREDGHVQAALQTGWLATTDTGRLDMALASLMTL